MPKNLYFIGDDHETNGCIHYGVQKLDAIKPNSYVLLLEEIRTEHPIGKDEFEDIKSTILENKQTGADSEALKILMSSAYLIYGFDADGAEMSVTRHGKQKENINYYVNKSKTTKNIENFIIIVGDAHLKSNLVTWTPLQGFSYGEDVQITYIGAEFLQK